MALCSSLSRPPKFASPRRVVLPPVVAPHVRMGVRTPQRLRRKLSTRAEGDGATAPDVDAIVKDLTNKWEKVENKSQVALYGVGAIAVLYVTSSVVGAVNAIPFLPKLLELVGFIYTAWFVYRYLLFKSSREELSQDVEDLKSKITGRLND